jgi:thiosulfate dehydrogenase
MTSVRWFVAVLVLAFTAVGALLAAVFSQFVSLRGGPPPEMPAASEAIGTPVGIQRVEYFPPATYDAPEDVRPSVQRGRALLLQYGAPSGNRLRCASCHFEAGITRGGRNGGFSLVGAAAVDPAGLSEQVLRCYRMNLDSAGPAPTSQELTDITAYLWWISKGVPLLTRAPWLGIKPPAEALASSPEGGQAVFTGICAQCHGDRGQGTPVAPPLWGDRSFTKGSQLMDRGLLTSFVLENMPRQNPTLSPQQASDAADFVLSNPRPALPAR